VYCALSKNRQPGRPTRAFGRLESWKARGDFGAGLPHLLSAPDGNVASSCPAPGPKAKPRPLDAKDSVRAQGPTGWNCLRKVENGHTYRDLERSKLAQDSGTRNQDFLAAKVFYWRRMDDVWPIQIALFWKVDSCAGWGLKEVPRQVPDGKPQRCWRAKKISHPRHNPTRTTFLNF